MENAADYKTILEKGGAETKAALLACARLIRAPLSVAAVALSLKSDNKLLALAAERYLESEDSPEAAKAILSLHPGEAKILGSTTAFFANDRKGNTNEHLSALFQSVANNDSIYNGWIDDNAEDLRKVEKRLQKEVKQDNDLFGAYAYDSNLVRIYKDTATYTWEEEPSRYRERMITEFELDSLKSHLTANTL